MSVSAAGSRSVEAFVKTDDPEYLRRAMSGLVDVVSTTFDHSTEEWTYVVYDEQAGGWESAPD
jgi:hypothetical protein